jgi:ABC-type multidrug transport system permease subunit
MTLSNAWSDFVVSTFWVFAGVLMLIVLFSFTAIVAIRMYDYFRQLLRSRRS